MTMRQRRTGLVFVGNVVGLIAVLLTVGCRTTKTADMADWSSVVSATIESPYTISHSPDSAFVLVASAVKPTTDQPRPSLRFLVLETDSALILQDRTPGPARVEWFDSMRVKVLRMPGMVQEDGAASGYLLQVRTGELESL
jgi:Tfp pilus assembly protein PilP